MIFHVIDMTLLSVSGISFGVLTLLFSMTFRIVDEEDECVAPALPVCQVASAARRNNHALFTGVMSS